MKAFKFTFAIVIFALVIQSKAQSQVFLNQGFENGIPTAWEQTPVVGDEYWKFRNGGHSPNDPNWSIPASSIDITRNPPLAHSGTYNAIFFKQSNNREKTKLITPAMNLNGTIKPELSFWAVQVPWTFQGSTNWDQLRVYYRTSASAQWVLLLEITDPLFEWTEFRVNLPNPSSTYQIAFEGETFWGYGTCIDDVIVEEKGIVDRWINEITVNQASLNFAPTNAQNIPILRLDFKVFGNTGFADLKSINVSSLNTSNSDIDPNGVKLYFTPSTIFSTDTPIGTPTSFNGQGDAVFQNINFNLPNGISHIWVTYDVSSNAIHNNRLDALLKANSIFANDTLYPSTEQSPLGYRVIYKTIYFEDFEAIHNWTTTGSYTVGTPTGMGGTPGNPDPIGAHSGTKAVYHPGNYASNLTNETAYKAESPSLNLQHYKNLVLSYRRYLNIEYWDKVSVQISTDNGTNWAPVWTSNNYFSDFRWTHIEHALAGSFSRSPNTKFRFQVGPSDGFSNYSGFSFDDVLVSGEFISKDVGVTAWISPVTGCGHTNAETVVVKVANLGGATIVDPIPVQFSLNGGVTWITNTLSQQIPVGDTVTFTFTTKANLSVPGLRTDVRARTALSGDQFTPNNQITTQIYALPTYSSPSNLSFTTENKHWRVFGYNLWDHGVPSSLTITPKSIGEKSWVTKSTNTYGSAFLGSSSTIFSDDFESDNGWNLTGEFERAIPDWDYAPYYPWSPENCLGTDLTGKGSKPFKYENGITEGTAYKSTSPPINVSPYTNVKVGFFRYFVIAAGDYARIEISPDNTNWITIWENDGQEVYDYWWDEFIYSISDSYTSTNQFRVRFSLYSTSASGPVAEGLSIDDFYIKGDLINPAPSYLESPCYNLSNTVKPMVEIGLWVDTEENVDGATLEYTLDGGTTWSLVTNTTPYNNYWNWYTGKNVSALGKDGWSGKTNKWIVARQILPPALIGASNVKFRFNFMCDGKNNNFDGIAIDKFKVLELPFDLGVNEIINPIDLDVCEKGANEQISVRVKNFGIRDMLVGDTLVVGVNVKYLGEFLGEDDFALESKILQSNLPAGGTMVYTFSKTFNLSFPGEYTIEAFTRVEKDPKFFSETSNDSTIIKFMVNKPFIELGPDIYTTRPDTVVLVATNSNPNITYNWYNNKNLSVSISSSDVFSPTIDGGQFWVTLEDELGCIAVDSIKVQRLIIDVGVTSFKSPVPSCELSTETPFIIWVTNLGSDTLKIGQVITLSYQIGASPAVEGIELTLTEDFLPTNSIEYTFQGVALNMSNQGNYLLKASATIANDNNLSNNTHEETVQIWGYPTFSLGGDKEVTANQYVVDAGEWDQYFWHNDGSTGRYFTLQTSGGVKVTIYDEHLCPATDSIYVTLLYTSIGVSDIVSPFSSCEFTENVIPAFKIRNFGSSNLSAGTDITYSYTLNNVLIQSVVFQTTVNLLPNGVIETAFTTPVNISAPGDYEFKFFATFAGDTKAEDDELIHHVTTYGFPTPNLGEDVQTANANWLLDAGTDADSYLWSTGETTRTITVSQSGNYSVVATNNVTCSREDNINVTFLRHDYGISEIINPQTSCSQVDLQSITVSFKNFGTETLLANQQVTFGYSINNTSPVQEVYTLQQNLLPGNSINFSFLQKVDFQLDDNYSVRVYGNYVGDTNPSNNELTKNITIYPTPYTNLGQDTTIRTGQLILDAGPGFKSYLWNDNSTLQTLMVTQTGNYWVTVTNQFDCPYTSSINVISLITDFGVTAITTPNSACALTGAETVSILVKNFGTDILYPGEVLPLQLIRNGTVVANEEIQIIEEFDPGDVIPYVFATPINMINTGAYTIEAKTNLAYDVNSSNDKFTKVVNAWGSPAVTHADVIPNTFCVSGNPVALSGGSPSGGTYTGNGILSNSFYPTTAGVGNHTITYNYTDPNTGCTGFRNFTLSVVALPNVTLSNFSPVCGNTQPFNLTGGSPSGGTYSGPGVSNGVFNPATAGPGTHTITYTYTDFNTCTNSTSKTIQVYSIPVVNLGDDRVVSDPFTLDAGPGFASYLWQDGSTNQTFNVTRPGIYGVTVTDANGCAGYDEVIINFNRSFINVISVVSPATTQCLISPMPITLSIENDRPETLPIGAQLAMRYQIGTGSVVQEILTLTQAVPAGGNFVYTFNSKPSLSTQTYNLTFRVDYLGFDGFDYQHSTTINPSPSVELGPPSLQVTFPYTLGAVVFGANNYLWSTNSTSPTITVYETGKYWLRVTNTYGCSASDSIYLHDGTWINEIPGTGATVRIYPNPVDEWLIVQVETDKPGEFAMELFSPLGQKVIHQTRKAEQSFVKEINVGSFAPGIYLLRVSTQGKWITVRIVKQ